MPLFAGYLPMYFSLLSFSMSLMIFDASIAFFYRVIQDVIVIKGTRFEVMQAWVLTLPLPVLVI